MKCNLKRLLFDRDLKQIDLQRATGIRYGTISAYYHGFVKRMNVEDIHKICNALGCSLSDLLEYTPEKNNKSI